MANKKKSRPSLRTRIRRTLLTTFSLALILYIAIHLLVRTEGFRRLVADKISNGTRLPVALERCTATPLLGMRLRGLDFYGVRMPDVRVRFNWFSWISKELPFVKQLEIDELEVTFRQIPVNGRWEPLVLHNLGNHFGTVLGLPSGGAIATDEVPTFPPYVINKKTLLQLRHAKAIWYDTQHRELAYISEVDSNVKEVAFSDRKALQVQIDCGHIKLASGQMLRDFRLEAVRIDGYQPVLVLEMSDTTGQYEGFQTKTLWQDLNLHLQQLGEI